MTDKTTSAEAQPQKKRRLSPYMMIWVVLTGLSIVYLALLATNPTMVANALGAKSADQAEQAQATAMLTTEIQRLSETVSQLSSDVQGLKIDVTSGADRERELLERVAALESPVAAEGQKIAALAPAQQKPAPAAPQKPQKVPGQLGAPGLAPAAQAPAAAAAPQQAKAQPPAKKPPPQQAAQAKAPAAPTIPQGQPLDQFSLETGSVGAEAPVNFGPATVTPAQGTPAQGQPQAAAQPGAAPPVNLAAAAQTAAPPQPKSVGIQIASGPSVQSLRLSWTLLSERHGSQLARYQPRYTVGATEQGVTYDLVVGPFANANEARQVCAELAASATPCSLQAFRGDAL